MNTMHVHKTPPRTALAYALAFLVLWCGWQLIKLSAEQAEGQWTNPAKGGLLYGVIFGLGVIGAGIVFWRVRRAYAAGRFSIWRALTEGIAGGVAFVLIGVVGTALFGLLALQESWESLQAVASLIEADDVIRPVLESSLAGIILWSVAWATNRPSVQRAAVALLISAVAAVGIFFVPLYFKSGQFGKVETTTTDSLPGIELRADDLLQYVPWCSVPNPIPSDAVAPLVSRKSQNQPPNVMPMETCTYGYRCRRADLNMTFGTCAPEQFATSLFHW